MSLATLLPILRQRLRDNSPVPTTALAFPNAHFRQPAPSGDRTDPAKWIRWLVTIVSSQQSTFGGTVRRDGRIEMHYHVQKDAGEAAATTDVETLVALFRLTTSQVASGVWLREPEPRYAGITPDGLWSLWIIAVPFVWLFEPGASALVSGETSPIVSATKASNGYAVGDGVSLESGVWEGAIADGTQTLALTGIVSRILSSDDFEVAIGENLTIPSHGNSTGALYVSQSTAKALVSTKPTSGVIKQIATATDANHLTVQQLLPEIA